VTYRSASRQLLRYDRHSTALDSGDLRLQTARNYLPVTYFGPGTLSYLLVACLLFSLKRHRAVWLEHGLAEAYISIALIQLFRPVLPLKLAILGVTMLPSQSLSSYTMLYAGKGRELGPSFGLE
jgi:hypothetical protein